MLICKQCHLSLEATGQIFSWSDIFSLTSFPVLQLGSLLTALVIESYRHMSELLNSSNYQQQMNEQHRKKPAQLHTT